MLAFPLKLHQSKMVRNWDSREVEQSGQNPRVSPFTRQNIKLVYKITVKNSVLAWEI